MALATSSDQPVSRVSLERPLSGPALSFDLPFETALLREEPEWAARGHNARTLAKYPDTRIVLAVMKRGVRIYTHETDERMTIHLLGGRIRVWLPYGESIEVGAGNLATLDRAVAHEIEAVEEAAFLLTVTWTR